MTWLLAAGVSCGWFRGPKAACQLRPILMKPTQLSQRRFHPCGSGYRGLALPNAPNAGYSSRPLRTLFCRRWAVFATCIRLSPRSSPTPDDQNQVLREPRWPAFIAMLAAAGVYLALPEPLSLGPSWLLLFVILFLMIPIVISDRRGRHNITRMLTFTANGIITFAMIASLIHFVRGIPQHLETPKSLLRSAGALWVTNILVFALWYWKLDGGGPLLREGPNGMCKTSFLFPQMMGQDNHHLHLDPAFRRLPVPRLQHQHRVFPHRHRRALALGQTRHDAAIAHFARHHRAARRSRRQHPLIVDLLRNQTALFIAFSRASRCSPTPVCDSPRTVPWPQCIRPRTCRR